ncbi:NAD(P) transhydrogenase alpha subunit [Cyclobacterium qasimii M12-11B]|uniref:proton-translocating NAD(P)(+) transhydrogenase n=1 Tax=Cyclobacterium qasimii M12-11B TaxID=641524 RepID=S7WW67_9BACT|nr:NAD(P) transhydrogenase alpha subunit [Cyclobacterium qasimii M12-11B]
MEAIIEYISINQQELYIFILAIFVGVEVISKVPTVLHTPLMSGSNALSGVVIVGSIIVLGKTDPSNYLALSLGFLAVLLATLNVVGGFAVTNRMLEMFKKNQVKNKNHDFTDNRYLLPGSGGTLYRWYQDDESSGFCEKRKQHRPSRNDIGYFSLLFNPRFR